MSLPSKRIPEKGITAYGAKIHNRKEKALARLKDAFSSARSFKVSADRMDEMTREAIVPFKLPPFEAGVISGYAQAIRDEIWHRDVRWQLYLDGSRVTSNEISAVADREESEGKQRAETWGRVMGRYEWISDPNRAFTEMTKA
jgi:hypothetical protein